MNLSRLMTRCWMYHPSNTFLCAARTSTKNTRCNKQRPLNGYRQRVWAGDNWRRWSRASCPRMSAGILGTNCDQCRSTVQYCFTSTETIRLIRMENPGRPPRLSHSSWTMYNWRSKSGWHIAVIQPWRTQCRPGGSVCHQTAPLVSQW